MKTQSIAAVIVTYNRLDELVKCVEMLQSQLLQPDKVYIIDNASTDGTKEFTDTLDFGLFTPYRLEKNTGGAGGFAYGLKKAYEAGYDWIWLMDDDGRPENNETLRILMERVVKKQQDTFALYNCNVLHDGSELSFRIGTEYHTLMAQRKNIKNGIIENCACVFNGSLVGRQVVEVIGNIRAEYFIRGDEVEYLMRCKNAGVYICTVVESLFYHPKLEYKAMSLLGKKFTYEVMPLWKEYLLVRNYSATAKITATKNQKKTIARFLLLTALGSLIHNKSIRRWVILRQAQREGKRGIFENYIRS